MPSLRGLPSLNRLCYDWEVSHVHSQQSLCDVPTLNLPPPPLSWLNCVQVYDTSAQQAGMCPCLHGEVSFLLQIW